MNDAATKKEKIAANFKFVFSTLAFASLFVMIALFDGSKFDLEFYATHVTSENVVSRWANLCYYTYWSATVDFVWSTSLFLWANFGVKFAKRVAFNRYLRAYVVVSQLVVGIFYGSFSVVSAFWSYSMTGNGFAEGLTLFAVFNALRTLVLHFINTFDVLWVDKTLRVVGEKLTFPKNLLPSIVFFVYYPTILLVCKDRFAIEWYPYPFFTPTRLYRTFFDGPVDQTVANLLFAAAMALVVAVIVGGFLLYSRSYDRRIEKSRVS